jgi:hypothetical protein
MFDAHLTPDGLSNADLETLAQFGVKAALVHVSRTAPRERLVADDAQLARLRAVGIDAFTLARVSRSVAAKGGTHASLDRLVRSLNHPSVVAIGPLEPTGDADELLLDQLAIAQQYSRRVVVSVLNAPKRPRTAAVLKLLHRSKLEPETVLLMGVTAKTIRSVLARGHYVGLTLRPDGMGVDVGERLVHSLGPERLVAASGAGEGASDLLALPRFVSRLKTARLSTSVVSLVGGKNLRTFLGR